MEWEYWNGLLTYFFGREKQRKALIFISSSVITVAESEANGRSAVATVAQWRGSKHGKADCLAVHGSARRLNFTDGVLDEDNGTGRTMATDGRRGSHVEKHTDGDMATLYV